MAITNYERVGKALELLKSGLSPFVEREIKSVYPKKDMGVWDVHWIIGTHLRGR